MKDRDWFTRAFGAAVTDIRQRLLEESYFGRVVTPRPLADFGKAESGRSAAEQLGWERPRADEPSHQTPSSNLDRGIDR